MHSSTSSITAKHARAIYIVKTNGKTPRDARRLAVQYGVTPKAVRDIWNHRTWKHATVSLWPLDEANKYIKNNLCARCSGANTLDISPEIASKGCTRCLRIVRSVVGAGSKSEAPRSLPHETDEHLQDVLLGTPLPRRMDLVWHRTNSNLGGLMDEALGTM